MKASPVFYLSTLDIFEFLADTRRFVDGVLSDREGHAKTAGRGRRALSIRRLLRRLSRALPELRERGAASAVAAREPAPSPRRGRAGRAWERTCGRSRAWASRSRWTASSAPGSRRSRRSARRPRPRRARSESTPTAARSRRASARISSSSPRIRFATSGTSARIEAVYKSGASALAAARSNRPVSRRALTGVCRAELAAATAALFWSLAASGPMPLIDSGREWIVPDALSRGQLLYRDVVYWFGPLTPYVHAAFFRVFGSSFSTLVLAGCVTSLAALVALAFALRRVADRASAALWTALAIPALVFMPNAGGSILGMGFRIWQAAAFALVAIALASVEAPGVAPSGGGGSARRSRRPVSSGVGPRRAVGRGAGPSAAALEAKGSGDPWALSSRASASSSGSFGRSSSRASAGRLSSATNPCSS